MPNKSQEEELDELTTALRALLTPFKHGCELGTLQNSYLEFYGGPLPYRKLGFNSVSDMLLSLPRAVRIVNKSGQVLLYAVECNETSHIAKLVRMQKSSKRPKTSGKSSYRYHSSIPSYRARRGRPAARSSQGFFSNATSRAPVFSTRPTEADFRRSPEPSSYVGGFRSGPPPGKEYKRPQRKPASFPERTSAPTIVCTNSALPAQPMAAFSQSDFGSTQPSAAFDARPTDTPATFRVAGVNTKADISAKVKLEELALRMGLGVPIYKILPYKENFMCSVHIGPHRGGSVREYPTRLLAECTAAQYALNNIQQYMQPKPETVNQSVSVPPLAPIENRVNVFSSANLQRKISDDYDFERLVENILQILDNHPGGLLSTHLPAKYSSRFSDCLPDNWLNQLEENAHEISVERIDAYRCIIAKQTVRRPTPTAVPATAPIVTAPERTRPTSPIPLYFTNIVPLRMPETPLRNEHAVISNSLSSPTDNESMRPRVAFDEGKNKVFEFHMSEEEQALKSQPTVIHPANPRLLRFPESDYFEVYVTVAASPTHFFVRIMDADCANEFNELRQKMDEYYSKNEGEAIENVSDFLPNRHFYAAYEEGSWHRVTVVEIFTGVRQAKVNFIDHGDFETIRFEDIRQLEPEFIACPIQAVRCSLENFESCGYEDYTDELIEKFQSLVVERSFLAQRFVSTDPIAPEPSCVYESGTVVSVVLYGEDSGSGGDSQSYCLNTLLEAYLSAPTPPCAFVNSGNDDETIPEVEKAQSQNQETVESTATPALSIPLKNSDDTDCSGEIAPLTDVGYDFNAYVTFAFDPSEFRVRPVHLSEHLSSLTAEMGEFYQRDDRDFYPDRVTMGEFCAVLIDGNWFRAFCSNPECPEALIFFLIDSGEFYSCHLSSVRRLPRRFRRLSSTIINCTLKNVCPPDKMKYYDAATASAFYRKTVGAGECVFRIHVSGHISVKTAPRKPPLAYAEVEGMLDAKTGESIGHWLVHNKYALHSGEIVR